MLGVRLSQVERCLITLAMMILIAGLWIFLPCATDDPAVATLFICICAIAMTPFACASATGRLDLLEPIVLVNVGYVLYFVYAPVVDLMTRNDTFFGVRVPPLLPLGLLCASIGLTSMTVGYYVPAGRALARAAPLPPRNLKAATPYALVLLAATVLLFGAYLRTSPLSWGQLLSFGQLGNANAKLANVEATSPLRNYLKATIECFVPAFMLLFAFARSRRRLLLPLFLAILAIYTTLGFRYRVLILIVAPAVYMYLLRKRRPTILHLAVAVAVAFAIIGGVGAVRGALRSGRVVEEVSVDESLTAFNRSLAIYQPFLVTLDAFPARHDFLWGSSFLYVVYQPIPRVLWPGKPPSPQQEIVRTAFGSDDPVDSGVAFPNIAEFYVNFGYLGVVICMFAFGLLMRTGYEYLCRHRGNGWVLVTYAVMLPFFVQLISRGYFVQTFTEAVFLLGPLLIPFCARRFRISHAGIALPRWSDAVQPTVSAIPCAPNEAGRDAGSI